MQPIFFFVAWIQPSWMTVEQAVREMDYTLALGIKTVYQWATATTIHHCNLFRRPGWVETCGQVFNQQPRSGSGMAFAAYYNCDHLASSAVEPCPGGLPMMTDAQKEVGKPHQLPRQADA